MSQSTEIDALEAALKLAPSIDERVWEAFQAIVEWNTKNVVQSGMKSHQTSKAKSLANETPLLFV